MKKAFFFVAYACAALSATAQVSITGSTLMYTQSFDALDTAAGVSSGNLPLGWAIFEYGTGATVNNQYKASIGTSTTGDTYGFGSAGSTDRALGSIASSTNLEQYGVKFANNTGAAISGFTVTYKGEEWRLGQAGRTNTDSLRFLYSTTAASVADTGALWQEDFGLLFTTPNLTAASAGALNGNAAGNFAVKSGAENLSIPNGASVIIKWVDKNITGTDDGLAVDSLTVTFFPATPKPVVTALSPANGAVNISALANPAITFDRSIVAGAGSIFIKNETDGTSQTIAAASNHVTISGNVAVVSGAALATGKTYHITFDSTAFDTAAFNCYGIYDTTAWKFTTAPAQVTTLTMLHETFDTACATGGLPAGWMQYSVAGADQLWHCSGAATAPNYYVTMNGYAGGYHANEDWLITPPLDVSVMAAPLLFFRERSAFAGDDLQVMASTLYSGSGDPNAVSWTDLGVASNPADSGLWALETASLAAFRYLPPGVSHFYLAFKYSSTATDGRAWDVDSVGIISNATAVAGVSAHTALPVQVLGEPTAARVLLGIHALHAGMVRIALYDVAGREVYQAAVIAVAGGNRVIISPQGVRSGLYIIRVSGSDGQGTARAFIR